METPILNPEQPTTFETAAPNYAGFWIRTGATVIDFLVYLPLIALGFYNLMTIKSLALQLGLTLIMALYKPFMEYKYGGTLGKLALKIKVVNTDLESISIPKAILRYALWIPGQILSLVGIVLLFSNPDFEFATTFTEASQMQNESASPILSFLFGLLVFISCLAVAFDDQKRALHDRIAGTYCIAKD